MVGSFHFSPTLHIFSSRRFRLKSPTTLAIRICFKVTKLQLLGAYMVATPSCHLGTASVCKILVTNFWSWLSQEWVGWLVTVRCNEIWSIFLVLDCVTNSMNLRSGLRQQWTGSQLIPSEVTSLLYPPKPAFSTHPQGPGTTHCSQACQNRKSISVLRGTLEFLL
jgi:hypothetical protein